MSPRTPSILRLLALLATAAAGAALSSCSKNDAPPAKPEAPKPLAIDVVKEQERSKNFVAVSRQLELGGTLYGYVDVDGDVLKMLGGVKGLLEQMAKTQPQLTPFVNQDYATIAGMLGLTDIKAVGLSSVPDGTGFFRNRMFFYAPGERHGFVAGLGGKPGPFTHVKLAPADAAFFVESEVDLPVVYKAVKDTIAKVAGEPASSLFEAGLKQAGDRAALSVLDLIYGLKGHMSIVGRVDSSKPLRLPAPNAPVIPGISLLITIDGVAPVVETSLAQAKVLKRTDDGTLHIYGLGQQLPFGDLQPVVVADGNTLYVATSLPFLKECRAGQKPLAQDPAFQKALAAVGTEGNGVAYVSPRFFDEIRKFESLNPNLPAETKTIVNLITSKLPKTDRPMVSIRTNLPDGILIRSYWDRSLKQEVAMVSVYNPLTVGLLAAMAIPAFQKVRTASQEKAIINNLRQLSAAADQYYLENGTKAANFNDLVGPNRYIKALVPVAGENYRQLRFIQGQPLRVRLPDGRMIQYPPAGM